MIVDASAVVDVLLDGGTRGTWARAEFESTDVLHAPHLVDYEIARAWVLRPSLSARDAFYVALAEALDCPLVTTDSRLARSHGHDAVVRSP